MQTTQRFKTRPRWPRGTYMRLKSGALLRAFMDQHNKSLDDVARFIGMERSYIWKLTKERKRTLKPERAVRLAELLQVPLEVLFDPMTSIADIQPVAPKATKRARVAA